jgi:hypothetical protein
VVSFSERVGHWMILFVKTNFVNLDLVFVAMSSHLQWVGQVSPSATNFGKRQSLFDSSKITTVGAAVMSW